MRIVVTDKTANNFDKDFTVCKWCSFGPTYRDSPVDLLRQYVVAAIAKASDQPADLVHFNRLIMFIKFRDELQLVGRILISVLFVVSGIGKLVNYAGTGAFMAANGLPFVSVLEPLTILVELGCGILCVLGLFTRYVGLIWFLFLIPVTLVFHIHPSATHSAQDQMVSLLKNLSIMGAAVYLMVNGAGRFSLDRRLSRTQVVESI